MTMIERVAASIVIAQKRGLDRNGVARAAIAAMRTPTDAMLNAAYDCDAEDGLSLVYSAMIDQALKDEA